MTLIHHHRVFVPVAVIVIAFAPEAAHLNAGALVPESVLKHAADHIGAEIGKYLAEKFPSKADPSPTPYRLTTEQLQAIRRAAETLDLSKPAAKREKDEDELAANIAEAVAHPRSEAKEKLTPAQESVVETLRRSPNLLPTSSPTH